MSQIRLVNESFQVVIQVKSIDVEPFQVINVVKWLNVEVLEVVDDLKRLIIDVPNAVVLVQNFIFAFNSPNRCIKNHMCGQYKGKFFI